MFERIYKDRLICDLRIIRKQNQATEKCHHLQIVLRSCQMRNLFTGNKASFISQKMLQLPKSNYPELELSLEKRIDGYCCCTQCREEFGLREYRSYRLLFERAKKCQYPVWRVKELYNSGSPSAVASVNRYFMPLSCKTSKQA